MFVNTLRTHASFQAIAMLVATSLLLWAVGAQFIGQKAQAAQVDDFSNLLSNSASGEASDHTITFTLPNGFDDGYEFSVFFDEDTTAFDLTGVTVADIDLSASGTDQTLAASNGVGTWGVTIYADDIEFHAPTDIGGSPEAGSSTVIVIDIGRSGPNAGGTENQITNPVSTTTSYTIDVRGTSNNGTAIQDSGQTRVAITDSVLVTAAVPTVFEFTVTGFDAGVTLPNHPATSTFATSSSFALPFGDLPQNSSVLMAQRLNVLSNAQNGFVVTVQQSQDLQSENGAVIDSFTDGSYVDTPQDWAGPSINTSDDTTWGHWGLSSDDDDFSTTADQWVAASTTYPRPVFEHATSADNITDNIGSTTVAYQIQVSALQEAADDYNTTLTYVATPTF